MTDLNGTSERERDADLKRIARVVAAEVLATGGAAASTVAATAAQAAAVLAATAAQTATTLAETTRLDLQYIKDALKELKTDLKEMEGRFVSVEAFTPVRNLVYGIVGLLLAGVVGGLLTLLIRRP